MFEQLGMSLGPYPLVGASPTNIHGHYESLPFHALNRKVQEIALGFRDDVPATDEVLARFLESEGAWPDDVEIPEELFEEGRRVIAGMIDSGPISGVKDPRTVLTWPFWRRVLMDCSSVRVVLVPLLRSPHEIAMSLCSRSAGAVGYWTALDVVAVHFARLKAILTNEAQVSEAIVFGSKTYLDALARATTFCGLAWDEARALRVFDQSCVHQEPAGVAHPAQPLYEELGGEKRSDSEAERTRWLLARDSRKCESMAQNLVRRAQDLVQESDHQHRLYQVQTELEQALEALVERQDVLASTRKALSLAEEAARCAQEECQRLRDQRARLESHPVLGQVLKARRRVRKLLAG